MCIFLYNNIINCFAKIRRRDKMRKNRLFIILVFFTVLAFFATAATCNMCGTPVTVGETDESTEETEELSEEEEGDDSAVASTEAREDTAVPDDDDAAEPDDEPEAEPDDEPEAEPDDEPEAEPDDEPDVIPEGGGEGVVFTCDANLNMSGYVSEGGSLLTRTVFVGDDVRDDAVKGFISFDITELLDREIFSARLSISGIALLHDPTFADQMIIKVQDYGELDEDDFTTGGDHLAAVSTAGLAEINITADNLKTLVERKIGEGKDYFQIKLGLDTYSDGDGVADMFVIAPNNAVLIVEQ
jgi:hypothetical protein